MFSRLYVYLARIVLFLSSILGQESFCTEPSHSIEDDIKLLNTLSNSSHLIISHPELRESLLEISKLYFNYLDEINPPPGSDRKEGETSIRIFKKENKNEDFKETSDSPISIPSFERGPRKWRPRYVGLSSHERIDEKRIKLFCGQIKICFKDRSPFYGSSVRIDPYHILTLASSVFYNRTPPESITYYSYPYYNKTSEEEENLFTEPFDVQSINVPTQYLKDFLREKGEKYNYVVLTVRDPIIYEGGGRLPFREQAAILSDQSYILLGFEKTLKKLKSVPVEFNLAKEEGKESPFLTSKASELLLGMGGGPLLAKYKEEYFLAGLSLDQTPQGRRYLNINTQFQETINFIVNNEREQKKEKKVIPLIKFLLTERNWIKSVGLGSIKDISCLKLANALGQSKYLTSLNIVGLGEYGAEYLINILERNTALTSLSIGNVSGEAARHLFQVLENNKSLTSLSVGNMDEEAALLLLQVLINNKNLTSLNIGNRDEEAARYLFQVLENNKSLTSFSVGNVSGKAALHLFQVLENNKSLTSFSVGNVSREAALHLFQVLENNKSLTSFSVGNVSGEAARHLFQVLENNKSLTSFSMGNVSGEAARHLFQVLARNQNLTSFSMGNVSGKAALHLFQVLENNKSLTSFSMGNVSGEAAQYLFQVLARNQNLTSFSMGNVSGKAAQYLFHGLARNQNLTSFSVGNVSGKAARYLFHGLARNQNLTSFSVGNVSGKAARYLFQVLENNKSLTSLNMGNVDREVVGYLSAALAGNLSLTSLSMGNVADCLYPGSRENKNVISLSLDIGKKNTTPIRESNKQNSNFGSLGIGEQTTEAKEGKNFNNPIESALLELLEVDEYPLSSILTQPSLLLSPPNLKNGDLYSVLPSKKTKVTRRKEHQIAGIEEKTWNFMEIKKRSSFKEDKEGGDFVSILINNKKYTATHFTALSIDGSGIQDYIPALYLDYISHETQHHLYEIFDYIGGTSMGGILSLLITAPRIGEGGVAIKEPLLSTEEVVNLFSDHGRELLYPTGQKRKYEFGNLVDREQDELLFYQNFIGSHMYVPQYSCASLTAFLQAHLENTYLDQTLTNTLVTAIDMEGNRGVLTGRPYTFDSFIAKRLKDKHDIRIPLWQVGQAASVAPTYFPPYHMEINRNNYTFIDASLWLNNPSVFITHHLKSWAQKESMIAWQKNIVVLSLGTGYKQGSMYFPSDRGLLDTDSTINTLMDISSMNAHNTMKELLEPHNYTRINPQLRSDGGLDKVEYLVELEEAAKDGYKVIDDWLTELEGRKILERGVKEK